MRWLRRAKKPCVLTDYRRVSDAVRERRAAIESDPSVLRTSSTEASRTARAYRPKERIRRVSKHARQFVEDSRETPREFSKDCIPSFEFEDLKLESRILPALLVAGNLGVIGVELGVLIQMAKHGTSALEFTLSICCVLIMVFLQWVVFGDSRKEIRRLLRERDWIGVFGIWLGLLAFFTCLAGIAYSD
jgi:hypothetical protein